MDHYARHDKEDFGESLQILKERQEVAPEAKEDTGICTENSIPNPINPHHYKKHPSGVECITITEHFDFCLGNAIKYIWRAGLKSENAKEDLEKARWYLTHKIDSLSKTPTFQDVVNETGA